MKWKQFILSLGFLAGVSASIAPACGDMCGSWGGIFGTGGSNLYGLSSDLYNTSNYFSPSYSGGLGSSFSSYGDPYGSAGLYGNNWGSSGGSSLDISIDIILSSQNGGCSSCGGYGSMLNPGFGMGDIGCSIGYCSSGVMPYTSNDIFGGSQFNPYLWSGTSMPWSTYPGVSSWMYNPNPYPLFPPYYGTYIPREPIYPYYVTPYVTPVTPITTTIPRPPTIPYAGCDGVVIPCPTGTVSRPPTITTFTPPPPPVVIPQVPVPVPVPIPVPVPVPPPVLPPYVPPVYTPPPTTPVIPNPHVSPVPVGPNQTTVPRGVVN